MLKILYICTHNRCRSILSEAISRHHYPKLIDARSAGSQPAGEVHPLALKHLQAAAINTAGLTSQSWEDFEDFAPDVVFTLCDNANNETCPVWFGNSIKLHWGLRDPSAVQASDAAITNAFTTTIQMIKHRASALAEIAAQNLTTAELRSALTTLTHKLA